MGRGNSSIAMIKTFSAIFSIALNSSMISFTVLTSCATLPTSLRRGWRMRRTIGVPAFSIIRFQNNVTRKWQPLVLTHYLFPLGARPKQVARQVARSGMGRGAMMGRGTEAGCCQAGLGGGGGYFWYFGDLLSSLWYWVLSHYQ